jgi:hypothetical protein
MTDFFQLFGSRFMLLASPESEHEVEPLIEDSVSLLKRCRSHIFVSYDDVASELYQLIGVCLESVTTVTAVKISFGVVAPDLDAGRPIISMLNRLIRCGYVRIGPPTAELVVIMNSTDDNVFWHRLMREHGHHRHRPKVLEILYTIGSVPFRLKVGWAQTFCIPDFDALLEVIERHECVVCTKHQNLLRTCHVHEVVLELLDRVYIESKICKGSIVEADQRNAMVRQNVEEHDIADWLRNADILRSKKAERLQRLCQCFIQAFCRHNSENQRIVFQWGELVFFTFPLETVLEVIDGNAEIVKTLSDRHIQYLLDQFQAGFRSDVLFRLMQSLCLCQGVPFIKFQVKVLKFIAHNRDIRATLSLHLGGFDKIGRRIITGAAAAATLMSRTPDELRFHAALLDTFTSCLFDCSASMANWVQFGAKTPQLIGLVEHICSIRTPMYIRAAYLRYVEIVHLRTVQLEVAYQPSPIMLGLLRGIQELFSENGIGLVGDIPTPDERSQFFAVLSWLNTMLGSYTAFFNTSTAAEYSLIGCMDLIGVIMSSHYRAHDFRQVLLADVGVHGLVVSIAKTVIETVLKLLEVKREVYLKFSLLTHDSEGQYALLMHHLESDDVGVISTSDDVEMASTSPQVQEMRKHLSLVRIRLVSLLVVMWHLLYSHHAQPSDMNFPEPPPAQTLVKRTSQVVRKTSRGLSRMGTLTKNALHRSLTAGLGSSSIGVGMKKLSRQFSRQRVSASPADEAAVVPLRRLSVTMATISDLTSLDDKGEHKVLLPPKLRNTLKEATTPRGRHIIARTKEAHVRVVAASRLMDRVSLHSSSLHARTHARMHARAHPSNPAVPDAH